jgi:hypothetical protein
MNGDGARSVVPNKICWLSCWSPTSSPRSRAASSQETSCTSSCEGSSNNSGFTLLHSNLAGQQLCTSTAKQPRKNIYSFLLCLHINIGISNPDTSCRTTGLQIEIGNTGAVPVVSCRAETSSRHACACGQISYSAWPLAARVQLE